MTGGLPGALAGAAIVLAIAVSPAAAEDVRQVDPGTALGNIVLPGLVQVVNGQVEGYAYMAGGPLLIVGTALQVDYVLHQDDPARLWELGLSLPLAEAGGSLSFYSDFAFERDLARKPRESYGSLLAAPFLPENLFDPRVLAVIGLLSVPAFTYDGVRAMGSYFGRPSVSFFGLTTTPAAGLALEALFALGVNLFVATAEEEVFRGVILDRFGPAVSAIGFGAVHLGNILVTVSPSLPALSEPQVAGVLQQSAFALCFGVYADMLSADDGNRLRKPVTLHYWNNVVAMIVGYMQGDGFGGP
jgi:membrane protease YdiL (CAAX protease family)